MAVTATRRFFAIALATALLCVAPSAQAANVLYLNNTHLSGAINATTFSNVTNPGGIREMYLDKNAITAVRAGTFSAFHGLTYLDLSRNNITIVHALAFANLTTLTTLRLNSNLITSIPATLFGGLTALTALYLSSNPFVSLPAHLFDPLKSLATLDLTASKQTQIGSLDFANMTKTLTTLSLGGPQLTLVSIGAFDPLVNVTQLTLWQVGLTDWPAPRLFRNITSLTTLRVSAPALHGLPANGLTTLSNLQTLDLDGSGLQYMAPGALDPLRKLTLLDLSRQVAPFPITWLHPDIFRNLTSYTSTLNLTAMLPYLTCLPKPPPNGHNFTTALPRCGTTRPTTRRPTTRPPKRKTSTAAKPNVGLYTYVNFTLGTLFANRTVFESTLTSTLVNGLRASSINDTFAITVLADVAHNKTNRTDVALQVSVRNLANVNTVRGTLSTLVARDNVFLSNSTIFSTIVRSSLKITKLCSWTSTLFLQWQVSCVKLSTTPMVTTKFNVTYRPPQVYNTPGQSTESNLAWYLGGAAAILVVALGGLVLLKLLTKKDEEALVRRRPKRSSPRV